MSIKEFWINNKNSFLYSTIALVTGSAFIIMRHSANFGKTFPITLISIPLCFLMAYGIYEFTGGDK